MKFLISELDLDVLFLYSKTLVEVVVCRLGLRAAGLLDDRRFIYFNIY